MGVFQIYVHSLGPLGWVSHRVAMSVCMYVCEVAKHPLPGAVETSGPKKFIHPLTRSLHDIRKWVFCDGTDTHTDGHGDSMTDPAQRAEVVKITIIGGSFFL